MCKSPLYHLIESLQHPYHVHFAYEVTEIYDVSILPVDLQFLSGRPGIKAMAILTQGPCI